MSQFCSDGLFWVPMVEKINSSTIPTGTQSRKYSNRMCTCTCSNAGMKENAKERFIKKDTCNFNERQFTENMSRRCQNRHIDKMCAHHSSGSKSGSPVCREEKDRLIVPPRLPVITWPDISWVLTWWRTLTMLIVLSLLISGVSCDLCVNTNKDMLLQAIARSAIPRGGKSAGHYGRLKNADTLSKCIIGCCDEARCNAVFFHNTTCYTISCDPQKPHACDALPKEEAKYKDTYFVKLRSTDETPHARPEPTENMSPKDFKLVRECEPDDDRCPVNEKCTMDFDEEVFGYRCKCAKGFERNKETKLCQAADSICEYGLKMCAEHEECVLREDSKSRQGRCKCVPGYQRDPTIGHCLQSEEIVEPESVRAVETSAPEKKSSGTTTTEPIKTNTKRSTTPPTSTKPPVTNLVVSAGKNKEIQLPVDDVQLVAFALPKAATGEEYHYEWSLLSGPDTAEKGSMADKNTDTLKLSQLIEGLYAFKIVVTGPNKYGEGFINVTVKPPARTNQPPVSIIKPKSQSVVLPKLPILDGSDSTDDDKVVSYQWEEVSGPIQGHQIDGKDAMLRLTDLVPGNYSFKLTVTDSDGATNSSIANVTVIKETDYPPKAFPGPDIVIRMPENEVTLYGNASTDDKEIVSYEWRNTGDEDGLTANMVGVHKPILHLSGLQEGDYIFSLIVTDSAGQTDQKEVHVFVKKAVNIAPVANAGREQTVALPLQSLTLNGTNSTDDNGIVTYKWEQISGPTDLVLSNEDKAIAMASGDIQKGYYSFQLTVGDAEKKENSAQVKILVVENPNKPPKADAGGDQTVVLPHAFIVLNGSKSSDDYGIVTYRWSRDPSSLAAGDVLNGSDHLAVMQVANVIPGRYVFNLKVTDTEGLSHSDTATVTVKPDPHRLNMLELHIKADLSTFTEGNKRDLEDQLALLLHKSNAVGDTKVEVTQLLEEQATGHLIVRFYVLTVMKEQSVLRDGLEAAQTMREIIAEKASILDYTLITVDTAVCQNNCSGHGVCDQHSKRCVCEAFWMENFFKANIGPKLSNCDWSILYVVIVLFLLVVSFAGSVWLLLCCCKKKRCRCWKTKRRHRYTLLHETEDKEEIGMIPKASKLQSSSLMMSDSDFTSEEETLFISQKKSNGHIPKRPNGISRPYGKNKAKA